MTRTCPIDGCDMAVADPRLMCAYHWGLVPRELQARVFDAWMARNRGVGTPEAHERVCMMAADAARYYGRD